MSREAAYWLSRLTDEEADEVTRKAAELYRISPENDHGQKIDWLAVIARDYAESIPAGWFNWWE